MIHTFVFTYITWGRGGGGGGCGIQTQVLFLGGDQALPFSHRALGTHYK